MADTERKPALYERKFLDCKALDIDTGKRRVKIAVASVENKDRDKDVFNPKAFDKTIKERGPAGTNELWHLLDHDKTMFSALSKFTEVGRTGPYLYGLSQYKDSYAWREVAWPLYEGGDLTQHSIGFNTVKSAQRSDYREIIEANMWEGSAVLWGANPNTPTLETFKSMTAEELADKGISRIERIIKALKLEKYEDDTHKSLLIIELKQLQSYIEEITKKQTTFEPSGEDTSKPVLGELFNALNSINKTFKN